MRESAKLCNDRTIKDEISLLSATELPLLKVCPSLAAHYPFAPGEIAQSEPRELKF